MEKQNGDIIVSQDAFLKMLEMRDKKTLDRAVEQLAEMALDFKAALISTIIENIRTLEEMGEISSGDDVLYYLSSLME